MEVGGCRLMCEGDYFNKEWAWSLGQAPLQDRVSFFVVYQSGIGRHVTTERGRQRVPRVTALQRCDPSGNFPKRDEPHPCSRPKSGFGRGSRVVAAQCLQFSGLRAVQQDHDGCAQRFAIRAEIRF